MTFGGVLLNMVINWLVLFCYFLRVLLLFLLLCRFLGVCRCMLGFVLCLFLHLRSSSNNWLHCLWIGH